MSEVGLIVGGWGERQSGRVAQVGINCVMMKGKEWVGGVGCEILLLGWTCARATLAAG